MNVTAPPAGKLVVQHHATKLTTELLLLAGGVASHIAFEVTPEDVAAVATEHGLPVEVKPGAYKSLAVAVAA